MDIFKCFLMNRFRMPRVHSRESIGRAHALHNPPRHRMWHDIQTGFIEMKIQAIEEVIVTFMFLQVAKKGREGGAIQGCLDCEEVDMLRNHFPDAVTGVMERGPGWIHVGQGMQQCVSIVVMANASIATDTGRQGFVPAIHRHKVDIHIDEQV